MVQDSNYRIEVAACPENPRYYRWTLFEDDRPLDLPGFAYGSAWSAHEAARVALHWHLVLKPLRIQPAVGAPDPGAAASVRDAVSGASSPPPSPYSPPLAVFRARRS